MTVAGLVHLVGAGPGDPELVTLRGLRRIQAAEVLVYDRLVHPDLLAEAPEAAERIDVGKAPGRPSPTQDEINALLVDRARAGRTVVRLKGGDPFVFGRGGEELLACRAAGVRCEVVPGLTSAVGVPTAAGIPLTHRALAGAFSVVTAHRAADLDGVDWGALARLDTLVVLMGVARLPYVATNLVRSGRPGSTPAAVIERGTWAGERVVTATLADLPERAEAAGVRPPAIVVVGEVAAFAAGSPAALSSLEEVAGTSSHPRKQAHSA